MIEKINPNKYYSIRQVSLFIPGINNQPMMKKIILDDIEKNDSKIFNTLAIRRGKQTRYFVKGLNIINYIKQNG